MTFLKAPWSNQRVSPIVRAGAWFFILCGAFALAITTYILLADGVRPGQVWFVVLSYPVIAYFLWLFGCVALRGKAPAGWLPSGTSDAEL